MPFFLVQFGSYLGMLRKVFVTLRCSCLFTCAAVKCKINTRSGLGKLINEIHVSLQGE